MKKAHRNALFIVVIVVMFYLTMCSTYYAAEPIHATVIDAETGQPIEGVVVVAHWALEGGLESGNNMGQAKVLESISDSNGRFFFPAWGPRWVAGGILSNTRLKDQDPELLIFKSGYKYLQHRNNRLWEEINRKGPITRTSDWNGKTIKMERFSGTLKEYAEHLRKMNEDLDSATASHNAECEWRNLPSTISVLGRQRMIFVTANVDGSSFFDGLISNEEYYLKK